MQRQRQLGIRQAVLLATALATQTAFAQTIPDAGSLLRQQWQPPDFLDGRTACPNQ
jgi:hypothetical protein